MKINLITAQMHNQHRLSIQGIYTLDITARNEFCCFSPPWSIVEPIITARKSGITLTPEMLLTYKTAYAEILNSRVNEVTKLLEHLVFIGSKEVPIALLCFCKQGDFCHRDLVAEKLFIPFAKSKGFEVEWQKLNG